MFFYSIDNGRSGVHNSTDDVTKRLSSYRGHGDVPFPKTRSVLLVFGRKTHNRRASVCRLVRIVEVRRRAVERKSRSHISRSVLKSNLRNLHRRFVSTDPGQRCRWVCRRGSVDDVGRPVRIAVHTIRVDERKSRFSSLVRALAKKKIQKNLFCGT